MQNEKFNESVRQTKNWNELTNKKKDWWKTQALKLCLFQNR